MQNIQVQKVTPDVELGLWLQESEGLQVKWFAATLLGPAGKAGLVFPSPGLPSSVLRPCLA